MRYAIIVLSFTSNVLSTLSGESSGSTSKTCFVISARFLFGKLIEISLYVIKAKFTSTKLKEKTWIRLWTNSHIKTEVAIVYLNRFFIPFLFHSFQLNTMLIILSQPLHCLFKFLLFVTLSECLEIIYNSQSYIIEDREDNEC